MTKQTSDIEELVSSHRILEGVYVRRLDASSDANRRAWRLGEACNAAMHSPAGDHIDRGLALIKELDQRGFRLVFEPGRKP